ncbi:MAG: flagellar biosynthesis protein FlhF [Roseburia sp.]
MTINKYQGKTKEEAIEKAKQELGAGAVVMNVKEIKPKGVFKVFKSSTFEVTAAIEEKEKFNNPLQALGTPMKMHESINLAADENLNLSRLQQSSAPEEKTQEKKMEQSTAKPKSEIDSEELGKRLEDLSSILEKQFAAEGSRVAEKEVQEPKLEKTAANQEGFQLIKMLYRTLLENDVNEKYVNQIMDEAEKVMHSGSSVDYILSSVYQKMILKFGQPHPIALNGKKPRVIFFIGPTGVGKTTTIAKIASRYKVEYGKRVAFLTADTYRIAATEQLRVYANILDSPMSIIYSAEELNDAIARVSDYDFVFVDTAGFSHRNEVQCEDMKKLIGGLGEEYEKEVFLVLSATTKYRDLLDIVDIYKEIADYKLIFTKLDETASLGNILNIRLYSGAEVSYTAYGQNVPDDIEEFNTQKIVKQLLGGR